MKILVTGGAGYIGSHTCVELLQAGHDVAVLDNFCNSSAASLRRVEEITGRGVALHEVDLNDAAAVGAVLQGNRFDAVVHFAALKAVGESTEKPLEYFHNNISGTLVLLAAMRAHNVRRLVFSSSATVYAGVREMPITEAAPLSVTNPYGRTKLVAEDMLRDLVAADPAWHVILLRYFNPVGAHESGRIGEDPRGIPNNLMPYIMQVAVGRREKLHVFGNDYDTRDGTGMRDYIHVVDLARGHLAALNVIADKPGCRAYNLGTGNGTTVLEAVAAAERATGKKIPYVIGPRRPGDVGACWADASRAAAELDWRAEHDFDRMCTDGWRWQSQNPQGYV